MINSATLSPRLMGSGMSTPANTPNSKAQMFSGFEPPSIAQNARDALNKFPPNPAVGPIQSKSPNLDALKLTPPSGEPHQAPIPAQTHVNPLSHETVNGAFVKKEFEQLHSSINDSVAQQRKTALAAFYHKEQVKHQGHQNAQIFDASLSTIAQLNQKAFELQQTSSKKKAMQAYTNSVKDHAMIRQLDRENQTSHKIKQATLDQNAISEKTAHYNRSIEAQNSNDNVKDNERLSKNQNRQRILAGNQLFKAQSTANVLIHHQHLDKSSQTLRRSSVAHHAYANLTNKTHDHLKAKNIYETQGKQIGQEQQKSDHNRKAAIHEHYQASDFKRAAAAQLYSANDRAVNKALTIREPAGAMAF